MGADYPGQEKALAILHALPKEAKEFLGHHLNNSLSCVIGGIRTKQYGLALEAAWHAAGDVRKILNDEPGDGPEAA